MKSLLFALGLALCCFVQADQDQLFQDIDHSKVNGEWIAAAMATNCDFIKKHAKGMHAFPVTFNQQSENKLKMTMNMGNGEHCRPMEVVFEKENGVFTAECKKGGKKTLEYVKMDGNSMFISGTVSNKKGECKLATLSVKNVADADAAMDGFRAFADRHGLGGTEIHNLPRTDMCQRSS